jgi:hypothetical protein
MTLLRSSLVRRRPAPLRARYLHDPEQATIVKRAGTGAAQGAAALHGLVAPAGTDPRLLEQLEAQARRSCVNLDTLRRGVSVATSTRFDPDSRGGARMRPPT